MIHLSHEMQININREPVRIVCVLDESGSMSGTEAKVIQSVNEIIAKYRETQGGESYVSLYTFGGSGVKNLFKDVHINEVADLTSEDYKPAGGTPLYDAVGKSIEDHRDYNRVFFVVDTDGYENTSKEYSSNVIRDLIQSKTEAGWDFTFVGADLSQEQTTQMAMGMNLQASSAMAFSKSAEGYATRSAALYSKLDAYTSVTSTETASE